MKKGENKPTSSVTQGWVLPCPNCGKSAGTQPHCVVLYIDKKFSCKHCKFKGSLRIERAQ